LATLEAAGRVNEGIALHLVKRIPAQAGLGGGSGNAAAAAVGVNALLELNLDEKTLHAIAASLGSDAPFFLTGGTATARGRGETLTPLPDAPPYWLVVAKPEIGVSTAWAYNALDADPERASHRATKRWEEALKAGDAGRMIAFQSNDFEAVVFPHLPEISWLHDELRMAGALTAHLCGSGSAVYGVVESEAQARRIAQLLDGRYPHLHIVRTLSRAEANPLASDTP
jgi:4-diphosphocytidyl-2-C-methyl-D-erythritol kinase